MQNFRLRPSGRHDLEPTTEPADSQRVGPVGTAQASTSPPQVAGPVRVTGADVVPIPPPLYFAADVAAGLLLHRFVPLDLPVPSLTGPAGAVILAGGVAMTCAAVVTVARHKTTIVPHAHVTALVTTGIFGISRNPMYAGFATAVAGVSLLAHSGWPLILLPAALVAVRKLVVDREERYLSRRFGSHYDTYRSRVPRWL